MTLEVFERNETLALSVIFSHSICYSPYNKSAWLSADFPACLCQCTEPKNKD